MHKLLEKSEISGTFWVEFNVSGDAEYYSHWQPTSRFASLDAMYDVYGVFSQCIERFDLYCPTLIQPPKIRTIGGMLESFASQNHGHQASKFAADLSFFLNASNADKKTVWMLGV